MKIKKLVAGSAVLGLSFFAAFIIILSLAIVIFTIVKGGWSNLTIEFITSAPKDGMTAGGIFPAIYGTFLLTILMSIFAIPIGIITAIYLSEYAEKRSFLLKIIRFAVNTLAGVPSIVFGLFGLGFFIQFIGKEMDSLIYGGTTLRWAQPNILWASTTMALLTLPVVIVSVEDAIRSVPRELREASFALGATKWQTIRKVVIPNSLIGILTGGILAVSRGAGEVAPILFTGAAYFLPYLPNSLSDQFMNLGYHIYIMSTQSPDVEATIGIQYATTLVLLILTFTLNLTAIIIRYRIRKKLYNV